MKNNPANFNPNRRKIFRYAMMAQPPPAPPVPPAPPLPPGTPTCPSASGGQGEIGGNDFAVFNLDAGTIFHELGHSLNLHHGGFEDGNCKPNYVSGMNYDLQGGIPRVGGGVILDYSPPRIQVDGNTRGVAPLANLVETNLTEPTPSTRPTRRTSSCS
ncbi:MAG: hypothetical protein ACRD12_02125 [Acidimicrobiales bacterium]